MSTMMTWVVWTSLAMGGGSGHGGSAVMGSAGAYRPVANWLAVEGQAGLGGIATARAPEAGQALQHFALGTRVGPQYSTVRPFLWLGLSHAHETPFTAIEHDPGGAISGESAAGVHHRAGVEAGLGFSAGIPHANGVLGRRLVTEVRGTVMHLPATDESRTRSYAYGEVALGFRF